MRSARRWMGRLLGMVLLWLWLAPQATAAAPAGALAQLAAPQDCFITPLEAGVMCGSVARGLEISAGAVAVSADGRNVYVASGGFGAIVEFVRGRQGRLRQLPAPDECLGGEQSGSLCNRRAIGLASPAGIAVTRDGRNVYVTSGGGDSVVELARGSGGRLRQLPGAGACIGQPGPISQGGSDCPTRAPGLLAPHGIAVSRDGRFVYVVGSAGSTLDTFRRKPGGRLVFRQCIEETGLGDRFGPGCTSTAKGLMSASDVIVSPNGRSVYVSSPDSRSVATFARRRNGTLVPRGCLGQQGWECGGLKLDLDAAGAMAISPDGRSLYLGARHLVAQLRRTRGGGLHRPPQSASCVGSPESQCPLRGPGLHAVAALTISPDGHDLYAAAFADDAVTVLARRADGALRPLAAPFNCLSPYPPSGCTAAAHGIWSPADLALSPDGRNAYVTGSEHATLALFSRRRHRSR